MPPLKPSEHRTPNDVREAFTTVQLCTWSGRPKKYKQLVIFKLGLRFLKAVQYKARAKLADFFWSILILVANLTEISYLQIENIQKSMKKHKCTPFLSCIHSFKSQWMTIIWHDIFFTLKMLNRLWWNLIINSIMRKDVNDFLCATEYYASGTVRKN